MTNQSINQSINRSFTPLWQSHLLTMSLKTQAQQRRQVHSFDEWSAKCLLSELFVGELVRQRNVQLVTCTSVGSRLHTQIVQQRKTPSLCHWSVISLFVRQTSQLIAEVIGRDDYSRAPVTSKWGSESTLNNPSRRLRDHPWTTTNHLLQPTRQQTAVDSLLCCYNNAVPMQSGVVQTRRCAFSAIRRTTAHSTIIH